MSYPQLKDTEPVEFGKRLISFISGGETSERIRLQYHLNKDSEEIHGLVSFGKLAQGPPGHAHGGAIAAVFDELMGACCWVHGYPAMTAQYTTRFFKPIPLNQEVLFTARIRTVDGSKINLRAKVIDREGTRFATARGLFILQEMSTFEQMRKKAGSEHLPD